MITRAIPQDEKDYCQTFLNGKYVPSEIVTVHMTPKEKSITVEVVTTQGTFTHHLRKKICGNFEEIELPGNDR